MFHVRVFSQQQKTQFMISFDSKFLTIVDVEILCSDVLFADDFPSISYELKTLPNLSHQFLFALVGDGDVFDEAREMRRSVAGQNECVACFAQEINEIAIVTW